MFSIFWIFFIGRYVFWRKILTGTNLLIFFKLGEGEGEDSRFRLRGVVIENSRQKK
jgi:hypothetical protein